MKARNRRLLYRLYLVAFLVFLIAFLFSMRDTLVKMLTAYPLFLVCACVIFVIFVIVNGHFLHEITLPLGVHLKNPYLLSFATSLLNIMAPFKAGAGFRAWYLRRRYHLSYSHFIASLMGSYIIVFGVNAILALLLFLYLYLIKGILNWYILTFFTAVLVTTIILTKLGRVPTYNSHILRKINNVLEGWQYIVCKRTVLFRLVLLQITNVLLMSLELFAIFFAIGIPITLSSCIFLAVISSFALLINLTPGSLGITEALYVISSSFLQVSASSLLTVALIKRGLEIIVLVILGTYAKMRLLSITRNRSKMDYSRMKHKV